MKNMEHSELCELKKQRIADMLEQFVIDTILSALDELSDRYNRSHPICHKVKCPDREHEPF